MLPRLCLALSSLASLAFAATSAPAPAETIPAREALAILKSLAGEWTGTVTEKGNGPPVTVIYRVTAAGTAVEELLFPGTPHEMVTFYHLDGDRLVLTHYCAMGNQPHMALAPGSTRTRFVFAFESATNLASPDAAHMHSGTLSVMDAHTIEASWDVFEKGAKIGENRFFLARK